MSIVCEHIARNPTLYRDNVGLREWDPLIFNFIFFETERYRGLGIITRIGGERKYGSRRGGFLVCRTTTHKTLGGTRTIGGDGDRGEQWKREEATEVNWGSKEMRGGEEWREESRKRERKRVGESE